MSRKRSRKGEGGAPRWDTLPWKAIEPPLERDDGWKSMAGDEQALLYTLEEISGSDYALQSDPSGGSQMVFSGKASDKLPSPASNTSDTNSTTHAHKASVSLVAPIKLSESGVENNSAPTETGGSHKDQIARSDNKKRKVSPAEGTGVGATVSSTVSPSSALKDDRPDGSEPSTKGNKPDTKGDELSAKDDFGGHMGRSSGGADEQEVETRPRRKKRRGQGKKKQAADNAAVVAAAAAAAGSGTKGVVVEALSGAVDGVEAIRSAAGGDEVAAVEGEKSAGLNGNKEVGAIRTKAGPEANKKKKKRKNRKKKKGADSGEEDLPMGSSRMKRDWALGEAEAAKMAPWMYLGVELHPALLWHLHRQGFHDPTPIQKRVLPKTILGRKDIIGAAETGSGKTLAFGLPVLSEILMRRDAVSAASAESMAKGDDADDEGLHEGLQALVLCPTRELALQVAAHFREVTRDTGIAVVTVVGGLAEVKQERQLTRRPEVVVATPGRFWELAGTHAHLSRLETLRHLVIDEADRMLERGHYPELNRLFSMIDKAEGREGQDGVDSEDRTRGGRGKGKRAFRSKFPFDISEGGEWSVPVEEQEDGVADTPPVLDENHGNNESDGDKGKDDAMDESGGEDNEIDGLPLPAPTAATTDRSPKIFARQTYVFSATLTLGASSRQHKKGVSVVSGKAKGKGRGRTGGAETAVAERSKDDDPVAKIMKRVGVRGNPAVIDMGRRSVGGGNGAGDGVGVGGEDTEMDDRSAVETPALPAALRLCSIKSLQMEKDVHAYLFCATYPGRTLIFVNAIACARRLAVLLCALRVPATPLHAQMQQRQRLKSLDRFTSDPKAVLVATDVAARGLDIPKVEHVVHYDAARSAEVFIHRAGRTARARAAGLSLSIVAPRDDANHKQTCSVLGLHDGMQAFPLEVRLVDRARERVGMALRVLKFQEQRNRVSTSNDFFRGLSKDADLVIDGDLLMEDAEGNSDGTRGQGRGGGKGLGRKGNQHAARLAAEARQALEVSLRQPLHSDRRRLIPVAQALNEMKHVAERTAAGDLEEKQRTRTGKVAATQ